MKKVFFLIWVGFLFSCSLYAGVANSKLGSFVGIDGEKKRCQVDIEAGETPSSVKIRLIHSRKVFTRSVVNMVLTRVNNSSDYIGHVPSTDPADILFGNRIHLVTDEEGVPKEIGHSDASNWWLYFIGITPHSCGCTKLTAIVEA